MANLQELNDHLFMCLERLNDDNLTDDQLNKEISRSKAIAEVGKAIVENANLQLQAMKLTDNLGELNSCKKITSMIGDQNGKR